MTRKVSRTNLATGETFEWEGEAGETPPPAPWERPGTAFGVLPDIKEFVSPVDRSLISSRSNLREHERRHGVRQCGELKNPENFTTRRQESI